MQGQTQDPGFSLPVGMQNGAATRKDSLTVSSKTKHTPGNYTLGASIPEKCRHALHRMDTDICSSCISNSKNLETVRWPSSAGSTARINQEHTRSVES